MFRYPCLTFLITADFLFTGLFLPESLGKAS